MTDFAVLEPAAPPLAFADAGQPIGPLGSLDLLDAQGEVRPLEEVENEILRFAITHYHGQMSEVARRLQIGRSTLYRKLKDLGFAEPAGADQGEDVAAG